MFKRGRTDGHLSKEEYHEQENDTSISKFQSISNNHVSITLCYIIMNIIRDNCILII